MDIATLTVNLNKSSRSIFNEQLSVLKDKLDILPDKPEESPLSTLCALWHFVLGSHLSVQLAIEHQLDNIPDNKLGQLKSLVQERVNGKPIAYIVGRQNFMGIELITNEGALIPRNETQLLAQVSLDYLEKMPKDKKLNIIDVFTGSGNLPICFAQFYPEANISGADISVEAIRLANENAGFNGANVNFLAGDLFEPFTAHEMKGLIDLISGCPPYIIDNNVAEMPDEISQYEPELAFSAGPFGFKFFMRVIKEAPEYLRKGGWLVLEVGLGQGKGIATRFEKSKVFDRVDVHENTEGDIRVVAARKG